MAGQTLPSPIHLLIVVIMPSRTAKKKAGPLPAAEPMTSDMTKVVQDFLMPMEEYDTEQREVILKDRALEHTLIDCENEIRTILKRTLEDVIRLGEIFTYVKDNLIKPDHWVAWMRSAFGDTISHHTIYNWMNAYKLYEQYKHMYPEALNKISLAKLYRLATSRVEPDERETVLELVESETVQPEDTEKVVQTYRKIQLATAGVDPKVARTLTKVAMAENPSYLRTFQRLSKKKQVEVAKVISKGKITDPKAALKVINDAHIKTEEEALVARSGAVSVNVTPTTSYYKSLKEIPASTEVNIAIVEAPLSYDFLDGGGYGKLTKELGDILSPGGFALITLGHKASMWAGPATQGDLKPLHLLCLRRQPGQTRSIPGLNINSASVFMALCYKAPYTPPRKLLADLQTIDDTPKKSTVAATGPTDAIEGLDQVETGLEAGFLHIIKSLSSAYVEHRPTLLHHVVSKDHHFPLIKEFLKDSMEKMEVGSLISVG
jgi:hypothetical protein